MGLKIFTHITLFLTQPHAVSIIPSPHFRAQKTGATPGWTVPREWRCPDARLSAPYSLPSCPEVYRKHTALEFDVPIFQLVNG